MPVLTWIEREVPCPECSGEGKVEGYCHHCAGTGLPTTGPIDVGRCSFCGGSGGGPQECFECDGSGIAYKEFPVPSFV